MGSRVSLIWLCFTIGVEEVKEDFENVFLLILVVRFLDLG
jgi:hypothetical protein